MSSLIEQIQRGVLDPNYRVADLLRMIKLAAVKLQLQDALTWVEHELTGYKDVDVPAYRQLAGSLKFHNPYHGWRPITGDFPSPPFWFPIAQIEALLSTAKDGDTGPSLTVPEPLREAFCRSIGFETEVRIFYSNNQISGLLDGVRNAVLNWSLKLEQAGVVGSGLSFTPQETARAQTINISIGSIGNASNLGLIGETISNVSHQHLQQDNAEALAAVSKLLRMIQEQDATRFMPVEKQQEAGEQIDRLSKDIQKSPPQMPEIHKKLISLRAVFEGASGNLMASGVIASLDPVIQLVRKHLGM